MIHPVKLLIAVGKSLTVPGVAAAISVSASMWRMARSPPARRADPGAGAVDSGSQALAGAGREPLERAPSRASGRRIVNTARSRLARAPTPVSAGTAGHPLRAAACSRGSVPTQGPGWAPGSAPAPPRSPNRHPTGPIGAPPGATLPPGPAGRGLARAGTRGTHSSSPSAMAPASRRSAARRRQLHAQAKLVGDPRAAAPRPGGSR
jgi:hypothetical protein